MLASRSASAYRKVGVETIVDHATPHQLVHMLYGLLQAVGSARQALERGDISPSASRSCWRCASSRKACWAG